MLAPVKISSHSFKKLISEITTEIFIEVMKNVGLACYMAFPDCLRRWPFVWFGASILSKNKPICG